MQRWWSLIPFVAFGRMGSFPTPVYPNDSAVSNRAKYCKIENLRWAPGGPARDEYSAISWSTKASVRVERKREGERATEARSWKGNQEAGVITSVRPASKRSSRAWPHGTKEGRKRIQYRQQPIEDGIDNAQCCSILAGTCEIKIEEG